MKTTIVVSTKFFNYTVKKVFEKESLRYRYVNALIFFEQNNRAPISLKKFIHTEMAYEIFKSLEKNEKGFYLEFK